MEPPPEPDDTAEKISSWWRPRPPPAMSAMQNLNPSPSIPNSVTLGFGVGVAFLFLTRSQSVKPLAVAIQLADGALKGAKALQLLHSPASPQSLMFASKALVKGYKASKRLAPTAPLPRLPSLAAKRLGACFGAVNLVRYARAPLLADGFADFSALKGGYKLSKNLVKVLEGFVGLQLDSAVRSGVDALGLLVKVVFVGREVRQLIAARWPANSQCEWRIGRNGTRSMRRVRLSCERFDFGHFGGCENTCTTAKRRTLSKGLNQMPSKLHSSELLCLSIPVHETFTCLLSLPSLGLSSFSVLMSSISIDRVISLE